MCGIMGVHGKHTSEFEAALALLAHRGPDGRAIQQTGQAALGHTRLAIVDVAGGQQPLSNPDQSRWLVCNGEIYNYPQLRAQHDRYPYKTNTDSEIILTLYEAYGEEAVRHLDGMFAFAIADGDQLFAARDPLGIKPLYYGIHNGSFYFASEIKALQESVEHIQEFPPGHYYITKRGFVRYYNMMWVGRDAARIHAQPPQLEAISQTLREAVRKRLMADVPLGVFLSGGLDSSIIAALVAEFLPNVHTFSVGVKGSEDLRYGRMVADYLGTQHHECLYTIENMVAALPDVIYHLESFEPSLVRSAIPNYFLARLASQYVKVALCGEGADELYAGYQYLNQYQDTHQLHEELIHLTSELYNLNLQRCDRMTMAHGLEGRVPFLDTEFIRLSLSISPEHKVVSDQRMEKWLLRKAFEHVLPAEVVWRVKKQFSQGAGSAFVFEQMAEDEISDAAFHGEAAAICAETGYQIRSKEELFYYRELRRKLKNPSAVSLVRQWRGEPKLII